jgi:hypothetical protein
MKNRYKFELKEGKWNLHDNHNEKTLNLRATKDCEKLVEWLNDQQNLINDLNNEEQRLLNVIINKTDEITELKKKLDTKNYLINKLRQILRAYTDIIEYIGELP